jgi:hypothetical protein
MIGIGRGDNGQLWVKGQEAAIELIGLNNQSIVAPVL